MIKKTVFNLGSQQTTEEFFMNYVLFMPDEMRAESVGCYGHPFVETPNLDRLAEEGTLFEQCHVQNPVCSPCRCSFVTGQYPHTTGHRTLWNLVKPYEHNLFRYMKEAGYDVWVYGKNDMFAQESIPLSADEFVEKQAEHPPKEKPQSATGNIDDFLLEPMKCGEDGVKDYANTMAGIEKIKNWKPGDKPFVLFLPLLYPHCPYTAPEAYYDKYLNQEIELRPHGEGKPEFHHLIREYRSLNDEDALKKVQAVYLSMITYSDMLLGRLMDALETSPAGEDTLLIATSDHGDYAGDYGLVEKWPNGFEDVLTRVPLIVRGPNVAKGHRVKNQVELLDLLPTFLESAGVEPQHTFFGHSLWPQLKGGEGDPERAVYSDGGYDLHEPHCFEGWGDRDADLMFPGGVYYHKALQQQEHPLSVCRTTMLRTLRYKLIYRTDGEHELYDLEKDPKELCNVYGQEEYAAVSLKLERDMLRWYAATSDTVPMTSDSRE